MLTSSAAPARRPHREWAIDALRALAILLVLGHHGGYAGETLARPLALPIRIWNRSGWVGVDLFFVLSGFLVSGLLFREWLMHGSIRAGRFLVRRGLKIYPAFYVYLAVVVVTLLALGRPVPTSTVLSESFFVQNYGSRFLVHTWSLAVEEHFYLLLTAAFALAGGLVTSRQTIAAAFAVVATAVFTARCADVLVGGATEGVLYMTHFRIDALAAGVTLAYFYHFESARFARVARHRVLLTGLAALLLFPAVAFRNTHPFMESIGLTTTYAGFCALLILVVGNVQAGEAPALAKPWAFIGRHSYSIYLWHMPVRVALIWVGRRVEGFPATGGRGFLMFLALSLAGGVVLSRVVELPGLFLRDRWFPSRTGVPTVELQP